MFLSGESALGLRSRASKALGVPKVTAGPASRVQPRLQIISRELEQVPAAGGGRGMLAEHSRPRPLWRSWERRRPEWLAARTRR